MTICPCCGSKTNGDWSNGCACGARSVGEPLPRPDHELPSYARALLLMVTGILLTLVLGLQTINAFAEMLPTSKTYGEAFTQITPVIFDGSMWKAAGQTAAWKLKWMAIPMAVLVFFVSRRLYGSVKESPQSYCGLRFARAGYVASAAVPLMIAILIGITIPKRLEYRQEGIEAGFKAQSYRFHRALNQYKEQFGSYPSDKSDLRRLADRDGSIAALLENIEAAEYKASAEVAAVPTKKPQLRGAVIRNASLTEETINESLSFTNYELRLPGQDKQLGTDDDLFMIDGVVYSATRVPRRAGATTAVPQAARP